MHEQILPASPGEYSCVLTDMDVRHTGYVDQALRAKKLDRDINILKRELKSGRMTRLSALTSVRSLSSDRIGKRRWDFSRRAWPTRRRATRSCATVT